MQKANKQQAKSTAENRPSDRPPFYRHYTDQPALAGISSWKLEDFVEAVLLPACPCWQQPAHLNQSNQIKYDFNIGWQTTA